MDGGSKTQALEVSEMLIVSDIMGTAPETHTLPPQIAVYFRH
jgi:hypothetical protein